MSTLTMKICSEWAAARKQLSQSLDAYLTISKSLEELGTQPSRARESVMGGFLSVVEKERALLLRDAKCIISSLTALDKLRNSSIATVPIGRLPSEILASVFTMVVEASRKQLLVRPSPARKQLDRANIVSNVCTYWRQIALSTPALWAHIDLMRRGGVDHATLWLQRAGSYPRYIRAISPISEQHKNLLEPYTDFLHSLVLDTNITLAQHTLLNAYLRSKQKPLILESLALKGDNHPNLIFPAETLQPSKAEMDDFLRPIRELYLRNKHFRDWTSAAFQDLRSLSLVAIPRGSLPTCAQILDILHASPRLQYLEFSSLYIDHVPDSDPTPATLNHLETLWLRALAGHLEDWLLKAIIPRQEGLTLALSEHVDLDESIGLGLLLAAPDRIKVLYFCWKHHQMYKLNIQGILDKFPKLETLAFGRLNFDIDGLDSIPDQAKHRKLQALDLVSCRLRDPGDFEDMVLQHSIDYLRMSECDWVPVSLELFRKFPNYVVDEEPGSFMVPVSPFD
ncbi:hypothetical protein BDV93DRAFT_298345 [Ceratobasidium sp. AG-I]|nr:hypothetical protein BDV93DRAFT_298345 [Ceratobasidium sp. AG-I]